MADTVVKARSFLEFISYAIFINSTVGGDSKSLTMLKCEIRVQHGINLP